MENANILAAAVVGAGNTGKTPEDIRMKQLPAGSETAGSNAWTLGKPHAVPRAARYRRETTAMLTLGQHAASAKHSAATNGLPYRTPHGGNLELLVPHLTLAQTFLLEIWQRYSHPPFYPRVSVPNTFAIVGYMYKMNIQRLILIGTEHPNPPGSPTNCSLTTDLL